ncbi:hypothetical protein Tco_0814232 [Tanacetum coccineum]
MFYSTKAILCEEWFSDNKLHVILFPTWKIVVKRSDQQLYKFKEGDFVDLHLNDIEDMLFLAIQHKLFHLDGNHIIDFIVALQETYSQTQKTFLEIEFKEPYTPSYDPPRIVYEDLNKQKRVMRADELYKFLDGTLKSVCDEIHHRGDWFSFAKCCAPSPVCIDENFSCIKHWKNGFFLIDWRAIPDSMAWKHPSVTIDDPWPAAGSFNMPDVRRLSAHVIKLRDMPKGVLVLFGLSRFWKSRVCDPVLRGADRNVMDTVMSDSEDSTITYTAVSSPFGGLSNIRSTGVDGPPVMLEDPYAYVVAAFQAPPPPDYVPSPEYPPSPDFVPEPVYPEFMPPEDEVLPAEEQPLPAAASPTADSPGYVPESDPEEDPEEDDDEDPEEDHADYPADRGNDGDDEDESSDDDEDNDVDIKGDEEEEEDPTPADPTVVALPAVDHAPSAEETEPFETDESAATPPPHPAYRVTTKILI